MKHDPKLILRILDDCCDSYTFPMLDNGYVYLAATRLTAFYSTENWALVIEVFGFSPRSGVPDIQIYTFADKLSKRNPAESYVNNEAYDRYLINNPHNESRFFYPIAGEYQDADCDELISESATSLLLRGERVPIPQRSEFARYGIALESLDRTYVYEICRLLATSNRDAVLGNSEERRVSVLPEMNEILRLEEWHHPDLINGERPSMSPTFRQIATVLATGNSSGYSPTEPSNTHWINWPEGGTL